MKIKYYTDGITTSDVLIVLGILCFFLFLIFTDDIETKTIKNQKRAVLYGAQSVAHIDAVSKGHGNRDYFYFYFSTPKNGRIETCLIVLDDRIFNAKSFQRLTYCLENDKSCLGNRYVVKYLPDNPEIAVICFDRPVADTSQVK